MTTLFDQQKVMEIELYNLAQEKLNEGREKGREEERASMLRRMLEVADIAAVSKMTGISEEEIKRLTQQS